MHISMIVWIQWPQFDQKDTSYSTDTPTLWQTCNFTDDRMTHSWEEAREELQKYRNVNTFSSHPMMDNKQFKTSVCGHGKR